MKLEDQETTLARVPLIHPTLNLGGFIDVLPRSAKTTSLIDLSGSSPDMVTYSELHDRVARASAAFRALGTAPATKFALCLPNSAAFVVGFLSLLRVGAIPILLNPQLHRDALRFVLRDSGCIGVLTDIVAYSVLADLTETLQLPLRIAAGPAPSGWLDFDQLIREAKPDLRVESRHFDDQAFQPYTAGSTGTPKGIVLTHGGMLWGIEHSQRYWPTSAATRGIVAAPMFHKNALRGTLKPILRGGGSVVIMRSFEPRDYLRALAEYRVTYCAGVPAMFAEILRHDDLLRTLDLSNLRNVVLGSSVVPAQLLSRLAAAIPSASVKESYGLTEGGGPLRPPLDGRAMPVGSIGVQAPEVQVKLVDANSEVQGTEGELWVRSPYVLKTYANQPELARRKIEDGWLKTGDLMRVDSDGFYYFLGRVDDMFVCGGENIYPKEIEDLILHCPDVAEVAVVPLPHETKGFAPVALVVPRENRALDPGDIQNFCAKEGPSYAIPRGVLIDQSLPLTAAGKLDRIAVRAILVKAFGLRLPATARKDPL